MDSAVVPEWVHLLPAGKFSGVDGRGPWTVANQYAVVAASMASGRIPVDENHATDLAAPKGAPSPARGWIVEMQVRPDGIWGRVDWGETGRSMLAARAYRSISPVFTHTPSGAVLQILRAALTNTPNLLQLKALNTSGGSRGIEPTTAERDVARRMGVDPIKLATLRVSREARLLEGVPAMQAFPTTPKTALDREIDGSDKDVKPTAAERDVARRMNVDPTKLARMRVQREAQQGPDDAARIKEFERLTTARNSPGAA